MTDDLPEQSKEEYLGDGLYASFDGWQVVLRAPREGGNHWVGLEPEVWRKLRDWFDRYPAMRMHMDG
jgi:hypothetical protein